LAQPECSQISKSQTVKEYSHMYCANESIGKQT